MANKFELSFDNCPPSQRQRLEDAARESLASLKKHIPLCHELNDKPAQVAWRQKLIHYLKCRYPLTDEDRVFFVKHALKLIHEHSFDMQLQTNWMSTLCKLLEKKPLDLTIDWRPMYDLLVKHHFYRDDNITHSLNGEADPLVGKIVDPFRINLVKMICKTRRYFPESATKEILATLLPSLAPFDNVYYRTQQILCLLLPNNYPEQIKEWLPRMIDEMEKIDRNHSTLLGWMVLFSRAAKHSLGVIDWSPYIPRIYTLVLQSLNLQAGSIGNPLKRTRSFGKAYSWMFTRYGAPPHGIAKYMAKLVIYTMGDNSPSKDLTIKMIQSISTFFYPSNVGSFSTTLGKFLLFLCGYWARRYGKQIRGDITTPEGLKLDLEADKDLRDCLLSVTLQAIFHKSPMMVHCAQRSLRQLAFLYPDVVLTKVLELVYPALADVTKSHRTQGVLKALGALLDSICHRKRFPQGAQHLEQLLWAILPGIDPNDAMKTMQAFVALSLVFYCVPLHDATESSISKMDIDIESYDAVDTDDSFEEDARRATMSFKEWSLAFTEAFCKLLEHEDKFEKTNTIDVTKATLLHRSLARFWNSLSPTIYDANAKKFLDFILSNQNNAAMKYFGIAIQCAAYASPEKWLELTTKAFFRKILEDKDGEKCLPSANSALEWNLYLLCQSVKYTGSAVMPYLDKFKLMISLCVKSDNKTVRKTGLKIAKNILRNLTSTYNSEARSFPDSLLSQANSEWKHWQEWGMYVESKRGDDEKQQSPKEDIDLEIRWHEPTPEEYEAAKRFVEDLIEEPIKYLSNILKSDNYKNQNDEVVNHLVTLKKLIKGVCSVLGDFGGRDLNADKDQRNRESGQVCPIETAYKFEPLFVIRYGKNGESLRDYLSRLVHKLFSKYLVVVNKTDENEKKQQNNDVTSNIKIISKLAAVAKFLLSKYEKSARHEGSLRTIEYLLKLHENPITNESCAHRPVLIERAFAVHNARLENDQPLTQEVIDLFGDLCEVSVHEYSDIAKKGLEGLKQGLRVFRRYRRRAIQFVLKTMRTEGLNEKKVINAMNVLIRPSNISKLSWDWPLLNEAISTLIGCEKHDDHNVQVSVQGVFVAIHDSIFKMYLEVPETDSENRNDRIRSQNDKNRQEYGEVMGNLVNVLISKSLSRNSDGYNGDSKKSVHWRYQMMAKAFIFKLVRKDTVATFDMISEFSNGILDELLHVRNMSVCGLNMMLATFCGNDTDDQKLALSRVKRPISDWNGCEVLPQDIYHHTFGESLDAKTKEFLEKFLVQNCDKVIHALISDHPALAPTNGKRKKEEGAGATIAKLVRIFSYWPYSQFTKHSKAFLRSHADFIKHITKTFPSLLEPLSEQLISLTQKDRERDAHCTAGEIFAGMVRGSVYWPDDLRNKMQEKTGKEMIKVMFACQSESVSDWRDCIRYATTSQSLESIRWLVDPIFESCMDAEIDSPSTQAKHLSFLSPILTELSWQARDIACEFLNRLLQNKKSYLSSPYKQVREAIARTIFAAMRCLRNPSKGGHYNCFDNNPELQKFYGEISDHLNDYYAKEQNDMKEDENEEGKNLTETLLYWLLSCIVNGDLVACSDLIIKSLGLVMRSQNHSDDHLSELAKSALGTVAWVQYHSSDLPLVLEAISSSTSINDSSRRWKVREAVLHFLSAFIPRHALLLSKEQMKIVTKMVNGFLSDPQLEVRLLASKALVSILLSTNPQKDRPKMTRKFMRLAKTKIIKKRKSVANKELSPEDLEKANQAFLSRHAGVLGLSAMVMSNPYSVPDWLPNVLSFLTDHVNDPLPIGTSLKKLFVEFKHTHQDSWHEFREKFSEDELSRIQDVTGTQSYFA